MTDHDAPPDRALPEMRGAVPGRPDLGGGSATPSYALPRTPATGSRAHPSRWSSARRRSTGAAARSSWASSTSRRTRSRVTGSWRADDPVAAAVAQATRMVADGADLLDVGGASSRPGHVAAGAGRGDRARRPGHPRRRRRAPRHADLHRHDQPHGRRRGPRRGRPPAQRHLGRRRGRRHGPPRGRARRPDRAHAQPRRGPLPRTSSRRWWRTSSARSTAPRRRASRGTTSSSTRASASARRPTTTSRCWAISRAIGLLGRPVLLGTSRKSTLGRVLDLPADQRIEATIGDDRARDRVGRRHGPRPRRPRERPRRPDRRTRSCAAGGPTAGRRPRDRPHRARGHGVPGHPRRPRARAA